MDFEKSEKLLRASFSFETSQIGTNQNPNCYKNGKSIHRGPKEQIHKKPSKVQIHQVVLIVESMDQ